MSIHKLTAGSGYDYLTRQVAVQDATDKGHTGLPMRWKPALNAFAVTFADRMPAAENL